MTKILRFRLLLNRDFNDIIDNVMSKDFNWKPYLIFIGIVAIICLFINWRISAGLAAGTFTYFVNDKLNEKKFPSLSGNGRALGSMTLFMLLQGAFIALCAVGCWFLGRLYSFLAAFVALTVPTFYFIIRSVSKK